MLPDWDGYKIVGNGDERIELDGREFCLALFSTSGLTFTVEDCLLNASAIHLFTLPVDRVGNPGNSMTIGSHLCFPKYTVK